VVVVWTGGSVEVEVVGGFPASGADEDWYGEPWLLHAPRAPTDTTRRIADTGQGGLLAVRKPSHTFVIERLP
jgi:hypothetical protein